MHFVAFTKHTRYSPYHMHGADISGEHNHSLNARIVFFAVSRNQVYARAYSALTTKLLCYAVGLQSNPQSVRTKRF